MWRRLADWCVPPSALAWGLLTTCDQHRLELARRLHRIATSRTG